MRPLLPPTLTGIVASVLLGVNTLFWVPVLLFFSLLETGVQSQAPILTLPVQ